MLELELSREIVLCRGLSNFLVFPPSLLLMFAVFLELLTRTEKVETDFWDAAEDNQVENMQALLSTKKNLDVNWQKQDGFARTPLHSACENGHQNAVKLLLAQPAILVNSRDKAGFTPLLLSCWSGKVEVVKLLLSDPRVDVNLASVDGCTPLWYAAYYGHTQLLKWLIALRGGQQQQPQTTSTTAATSTTTSAATSAETVPLDLHRKGKRWDDKSYSPLEIAKREGRQEVCDLLREFMEHPVAVRQRIRIELGLVKALAGDLFATMVLFCDHYYALQLSESGPLASHQGELQFKLAGARRFFGVAQRLPMELQMVLCHRVYGSAIDSVLSTHSEPAFQRLLAR